ncbi:MAG: FAD-binding oxidoreductase [Bdellovibrionota bacterium]
MKKYSVAIVGGGITGLSVAEHLRQFGIDDIVLIDPYQVASTSSMAAGFVSGGFTDNFSRLTHVHGLQESAYMWGFADRAFDFLREFVDEQEKSGVDGLSFLCGDRIRVLTSEHELKEAEIAVSQMQSQQIEQRLLLDNKSDSLFSRYSIFSPGFFGFQIAESKGGYVQPLKLLAFLRERVESKALRKRVVRIESNGGPVVLTCDSGEKVSCEIMVLANHLGMSSLLPELKSCLISYADSWLGFDGGLSGSGDLDQMAGVCFSFNHGYEWGGVASDRMVFLGGARYLRKNAGIAQSSADAPEVSIRVGQALETKANEYLQIDGRRRLGSLNFGFGCRPCDELPLIGPMFGEPRILLATGYMGNGLSFGFYAGYCLAKLIGKGVCDELPRKFWPERLRSLES